MRGRWDRLQAEGVITLRNHRQGDRRAIAAAVHVLGFEPCAQPWIEDLRLALPEIGSQSALDPKMIQLQLD